jgi:hypothetical protein
MKGITLGLLGALSMGLMITSASAGYAGEFKENHPRRAEVLNRNHNINRRLNKNYGNLDGHYGQLKKEDKAIVHQEQRDAKINGGFITKGQKKQLNREENHLNNQIHHDENK